MSEGSEETALAAGRLILSSLSIAAGIAVALTGICAGIGFMFARAYTSTIGADWAVGLMSVTNLIGQGAPFAFSFASAVSLALLFHAINAKPPRFTTIALVWIVVAVAACGLFFVDVPWALFLLIIATSAAIPLATPSLLLNSARAWSGRQVATLAMAINAVAILVLAPALFGSVVGLVERLDPSNLSEVKLRQDSGSWRVVLVVDQKLLLTHFSNGIGFQKFRVVEMDGVETIKASRHVTPWAPSTK